MFRTHIFPLIGIAAALVLFGVVTAAQDTTSPSARDKKFVRSVVEGQNAAIALSQLALKKSKSGDVKQFGQTMIEGHMQLGDLMLDVARKEHLSPPTGTSAKDKALESKLKKLSGAPFDKAYIAATVKDHRQDLDEFNREAIAGNDTAIKHAASQGALVIGEQLEQAKRIARSHNVEPAP